MKSITGTTFKLNFVNGTITDRRTNMNIQLNLDVEISYDKIPSEVGGIDENNNVEYLFGAINITSVKAKGIEIISLLDEQELRALSEEILEKES